MSQQRGVIELEFGVDDDGKPVKRKLRLGSFQLAKLERLIGRPFYQVIANKDGMSLDAIVTALYVGMAPFDDTLDMETVANTLDDVLSRDTLQHLIMKLHEAISVAMPHMSQKSGAGKPAPLPAEDVVPAPTS